MDFLSLCRRLRQETGITNTGPSNVTSQTGDLQRIVDWVSEAWLRLQARRDDWAWMWREGTLSVTSGTKIYSLASTVKTLDVNTLYLGVGSDRYAVTVMDYTDLRDSYRNTEVRRPSYAAVRPDGDIEFDSVPDQDYTLTFEYFAKPARMTTNIEAPTIDDEYHMIIVWSALMEYAMFDEAPELYQKGKSNYDTLLAELESNTLPQLEFAGPVA